MSNACGCQNSGNTDFAELAPVLEKYAKVPGSLITILQQRHRISMVIFLWMQLITSQKEPGSCLPKSTE